MPKITYVLCQSGNGRCGRNEVRCEGERVVKSVCPKDSQGACPTDERVWDEGRREVSDYGGVGSPEGRRLGHNELKTDFNIIWVLISKVLSDK